jgi:hypothetical protein
MKTESNTYDKNTAPTTLISGRKYYKILRSKIN